MRVVTEHLTTSLFVFAVGLIALPLFAGAVQAPQALTLDDVLNEMDAVSAEFRDMEADIERETVTVFINHSRFEFGKMYFVRDGDRSRIRITLTEPSPKEFLIDDGKVRIYNPGTNVLEEISLGEHEDKVGFMVVGFGTSREELLRQYEIELAPEESLGGAPVSVLDLTPRDPEVARYFSQIRLWIDQDRWIPVQTKAVELSGDYLIVRFSNVRINAGVPASVFRLELPRDVQVVRP